MRRWKSILCALIAGLLTVSATGCGMGRTGDSDQVTWIMAHTVTEDVPLHKAAVRLAEEVKEATNGKFIIEIYPNSMMGGNREVLEGMQFDTFQMTMPNVGMLSGYSDYVSVLELPYLIQDVSNFDDADAVFNSDVLKPLYDDLQASGFRWMAGWYQGNRNLTTTKTAVHTPADMKGLKIRTMESAYHMAHFNALGANAIPMAFSEVFTALQQGALDGQENPYCNIYTQGIYEVQGYIIETAHTFDIVPLLVSEEAYEKLPEEYQKILDDAVDKLTMEQWEMAAESEAEYKQKILDSGKCQVIELTPEERLAFRDAAQPVYDMYVEEHGSELLDAVMAAQEAVKH